MTRQSLQQGYVSDAIRTRNGIAYKIRYRVRAGRGKWKQKSETLYGLKGKKAARKELADRIKDSSATAVGLSEMTFEEFVERFWQPYLDRKNVKPSTRRSYRSMFDLHILPVLGELYLRDVSPLHVDEMLQVPGLSSCSAKTVRNLVGLLGAMFALAVDKDLVVKSPVRKSHKPTVERLEKQAWSPDQLRLIIEGVSKSYRAFFVCAALTGARLGELLALRWSCIDFQARTIRIERSLWQGELVKPKTQGSVRTIAFGTTLAQVLTSHMEASVHIGSGDFVFCKPDGTPYHPDVLRKDVLYPTLDRLQIPRPARASGFHAFRHSAATVVSAQTGNLKLAQKLLGHSQLASGVTQKRPMRVT